MTCVSQQYASICTCTASAILFIVLLVARASCKSLPISTIQPGTRTVAKCLYMLMVCILREAKTQHAFITGGLVADASQNSSWFHRLPCKAIRPLPLGPYPVRVLTLNPLDTNTWNHHHTGPLDTTCRRQSVELPPPCQGQQGHMPLSRMTMLPLQVRLLCRAQTIAKILSTQGNSRVFTALIGLSGHLLGGHLLGGDLLGKLLLLGVNHCVATSE